MCDNQNIRGQAHSFLIITRRVIIMYESHYHEYYTKALSVQYLSSPTKSSMGMTYVLKEYSILSWKVMGKSQ